MNKGVDILLDYLVEEDVRYLFGNPGSTEAPLVDRISTVSQLTYILALHEGSAVGMADGYALASGKVGVVNLHVAPGLGNGLGMIFNAYIGRSPLVVLAGQQDTRMRLREPLLAHDLVSMATPVTKWSVQVERADEIPLILHRAFSIAKTPPAGPVLVSLPINILEEQTNKKAQKSQKLVFTSSVDHTVIEEIARMLLESSRPVIIFGDEIHRYNAQQELVAVAEFLGATVWSTIIATGVGFPTVHSQFRGELPDTHQEILDCIGESDCVLLVGGDFFKEVYYHDGSPFPDDAKLIHIEASPDRLARNFPVSLGIAADLNSILFDLAIELDSIASVKYRTESETRRQVLQKAKSKTREAQEIRVIQHWNDKPMSPARLMKELAVAFPANVIVVGETLTGESDLFNSLYFNKPGDYFGSRGGGIGQGIPGAVGIQLAYPDRPVVALSGDGSAIFNIQALWTASHYQIPVLFIILNNLGYKILKGNLIRYRRFFNLEEIPDYPLTSLTEPGIDFVSLAAGFGVKGQAIREPEEIAPAVSKAFALKEPFLLDIAISEV